LASASAQTFHGSIRGRLFLRDGPSAIGECEVTLTDARSGMVRRTVSTADGEYLFAGLPPGFYNVRAEPPGFSPITFENVRVGTGAALVLDLELKLTGSLQLEVTGDLDRAHGVLGIPFVRDALIAQPTAGRNIFMMGTLAPTVIPTGNAVFVRQQDQSNASLISMAGSARRANTYVLDGVPIVDIQNRAVIIPGMESVEELRVQLGPYDAQVGRTSGGVFNVSARSGGNAWSGSGVYQTRPDATQAQLFFEEKANLPKIDTSYHLFAGSAGGRIVRNRTFVFVSGEGYRTESPRNAVLVLPTPAERRGDFSQSAVTIYDPLSTRPDPARPGRFIRDPFPNNQIPASRLNPVAQAMLAHLPQATNGKSMPVNAAVVDQAKQLTGKLTQQWTPQVHTSLMYAWYQSFEPDARFFGGGLFENGADPGDGALERRVNFLALNQGWAINNRSLLQVRYGLNRFLDDNRGADFDPATLGFDPSFIAAVPYKKFPNVSALDYGQGGALLGDRDRQRGVFSAHAVSGVFTTLKDRHTLRAGGEYRLTGLDFENLGGSGYYNFTRDFTRGPDPLTGAGATGDSIASLLLGFPAGGGIYTSSPINAFLRYGAGFIQDDFRLHERLTVNFGLRYEFEDGLREVNDRLVVGWASDTPFPIQVGGTRPDGTPLTLAGGLVYAGVNGAPTVQGSRDDRWRLIPRLTAAWAVNDRTTVRGGYGVFRAPQQGINASETGTGTRGYNVTTNMVTTLASPFVPCATCSLTNPFPSGFAQPTGNTLGVMTGVGGGAEYVDPASTPGHYHRYSVEVDREVGDGVRVSAAYAGATGRDLAIGGSSGSFFNVNQLDPRYQSLGNALVQPVPNPFFGTPIGVGLLAGPEVPASQLLRPYPQFDAVYALRSSLSRARFDALILGADRRFAGWSLQANYTFSRQQDDQFSESNFFSEGSTIQNYYDIDAEYGLSVLDVPHRLNVLSAVELPWGFSASVAATLQSGFPIAVSQASQNTGLLGGTQRPNVVPGADQLLTGNPVDAFDPACSCIKWLNPAAWSVAPPFTFGNAPRADGRARTPGRRLIDVAIGRAFRMTKGSLTLRAEIINVLNARDFRGPNNQLGSSTFGEIRSDSGFPRTLQLRARYAW
jgi:hypothetical protein